MNVNKVLTKDYEIMDTWSIEKNKANTKPIQTQYKANTNPIQTHYKAKQTQFIVSLPNLFHMILACFSSRAKKCCSPAFCYWIRKDKTMLFKNVYGKCRL